MRVFRPACADRSAGRGPAGACAKASDDPRARSGRFSLLTVTTCVSVQLSSTPRPRLTREDVLDGRQVADLLHMPISTVLEYARRGLLPARKLGRRWIFLRDEIENAVRGQPGDWPAA